MRIDPKIKFLLSTLLFVAIIGFAFWLTQEISGSEHLQAIIKQYGYFGIFAAAVISGFNLLIPIPAASFIPALLESGLQYWPSILLLTLGMTAADMVAYVLGRAGRGVFSDMIGDKVIRRFERLRDRHPVLPFVAIFLFASIAPVPNELIVIPLGFLKVRMWLLMLAVFAGNFVFNTLYSKGFIELFRIF